MDKIDKLINIAYEKYFLWQTPSEIKKFAEFYHDLNCKNILEIGTLYGGNFYLLCKLSNIKGKKITIDYPFYPEQDKTMIERNTSNEIDKFADNVYILKNDSHNSETIEKVKEILNGEELDFIFIDGDHTYEGVKQDYEQYKPFLKDGGYIAFHDITDTDINRTLGNQVNKLWNELPNDNKIEFNEHGPYMGIGVIQCFKYRKKLNIELLFESPNKIVMNNHDYNDLDCIVVIKDKDTDMPMYYTDIHFTPETNSWWIMPAGSFNYMDEIDFSGFLVEFYDKNKNFIYSKEIFVKDRSSNIPDVIFKKFSPFHCLFNNFRQMFYHKTYDILNILDIETAIDIGANCGLFTKYLMYRCKNIKLIHSIEPSKSPFNELKNQFDYCNGIKCHKLGIHSFTGKSFIHNNLDNSTISSFDRITGDHINDEEVNVMTLTDFLNSQQLITVDLIKIDVEGLEYEIINATSDENIKRASKYLIEYHPNGNNSIDVIIDRFKILGYDVIKYPDNDPIYGYIFANKIYKEINENNSVDNNKSVLPKKAFVSFTNEKYLDLAEQLVKSVKEFSDYPIILYSINCDIPFKYDNLYTKRIDSDFIKTPKYIDSGESFHRKGEDLNVKVDTSKYDILTVDRNDINTYITLSRKGHVILDALDNGLEEGIFLDADGIVKENIDESFDYFKQATNYPLVGKGLFEFMMLNGKGDPAVGDPLEAPLMKLLGVTNRTMHYVTTNFILFNNKMKDFFREMTSISNNETILADNVLYTPYHDETLINVLLWKYKATKHLPVVHFNLIDSDKAIDFYNTSKRDCTLETDWQYVPEDKNDVKFFHGCKSISEIKRTIEHIKNIRKPVKILPYIHQHQLTTKSKIAIVTLHDDNYMGLAPYSIKNKKQYADKHGYDFIYYDDIIDKSRPPQWSKVLAIQSVLNMGYEWVWWIDIDALIMNPNIKLESIVDNNYDMIFTKNEYSFISNGSSFFKNSTTTKNFLNTVYDLSTPDLKSIDIHTFDHEQKAMRVLLQTDVNYLSHTKLIDERVCNSYYVTNDKSVLDSYPNWNTSSNLYQDGDFIIQFCGRSFDERLKQMKQFYNGK